MINKQKILFLLTALLTYTYQCDAMDTPDLSQWIQTTDDDSNIFPDYDKPLYDAWSTVKAFTRSCVTGVDGIIDAQGLLQNDLYNFTHPINQRSIQDLPQFYFFLCPPPAYACTCPSWQFLIEAFYNKTHKTNLTKESTAIKSYLNFSLARELEQFAFDIDIPHVLSLFENLKAQERRAGIMLGGLRTHGKWNVGVRTPLEYLIRNFYLTDQELKEIEAEPLFDDTDPDTDNDKETKNFIRKHLIADRFGIGDTRIHIGYTTIDNPCLLLNVGFEATLPTAFAFKKGLYGNHFPKHQVTPSLDLVELLNLASTNFEQTKIVGEKFLTQAIDRLSRILLETGLGNNGHVGLGVFTYSDMCLNSNFTVKTRAALEYLLPSIEWRYFIKKKNLAEFEKLKNATAADCDQELKFLENEIIDTLFPQGFGTVVFPGFIFKLTNVVSGTLAQRWQLALGYDIWWQQKEHLGTINTSKQERSLLKKDIATRPDAFQSKIFGSATLFKKGPECTCDWSLSLYADRTFLRSGIGKDFNIALRFELLL